LGRGGRSVLEIERKWIMIGKRNEGVDEEERGKRSEMDYER
jgi:hypothetical protein